MLNLIILVGLLITALVIFLGFGIYLIKKEVERSEIWVTREYTQEEAEEILKKYEEENDG